MRGRGFVDTNVFVYSVDQTDMAKHRRSRELLASLVASRAGVISSQVALELAANLIKKAKLDPVVVAQHLNVLDAFECVPLNPDLVRTSLRLIDRISISVWDAAILAAAIQAKCRVLYTEDFQSGQVVEGVQLVNPFV